jgi:hypothetical protein
METKVVLRYSPKNDLEPAEEDATEVYSQGGTPGQIYVDVTCKGEPVPVVVHSYTFNDRFMTDGNGYRPTLQSAAAPTYYNGPEVTNDNPLPVWNIGAPGTAHVIEISATASGGSCGEFPAGGLVNIVMLPLTTYVLSIPDHTRTRRFEITPSLRFGVGSLVDPGFVYEQENYWHQTGWFGIIQLMKGTYKYVQYGTEEWRIIWESGDFVLDLPRNSTEPVDIAQDKLPTHKGFITTSFVDSPSIDIREVIRILYPSRPRKVRLDASFLTYVAFNPSKDDDPTHDPHTTWYTVGVGGAWNISGEAEWNGEGTVDDRRKWTITKNHVSSVSPVPSFPLPTWSGSQGGAVEVPKLMAEPGSK